jgi:hypothetical protein
MADTAHGDIVYPLGGDDFSVPGAMLAMANSLDPRVIGQYASVSARNTATSALTGAGKRVVAWVDGNVGLCAHNGTTWVNLSPSTVAVGAQVLIQRVTPGLSWVAPTAAVTTVTLVNGQYVDVRASASIRVDGSLRQTCQFGVSVTNAILSGTPPLAPEMLQQSFGDGQEWHTSNFEARYYAAGGAMTVKFALQAGAGGNDLVIQQAQCWVTVHPAPAV